MKDLNSLTIKDDFIFNKVFSDAEVAKDFIELLTGNKISKINFIASQSVIDNEYNSRGIRFDVEFVGDEAIYDIEMQNSSKGDILRRIRYYQSSIDTRFLAKGKDYSDLPNSIVIFICTYDVFKNGNPIYTVEPAVKEIGRFINNGTRVYILNTKYTKEHSNRNIVSFLDYVEGRSGKTSMNYFVDKIDKLVSKVKESSTVRREFMSLQELIDRERKEAAKEAAKLNARVLAENLDISEKEAYDLITSKRNKTTSNITLNKMEFK